MVRTVVSRFPFGRMGKSEVEWILGDRRTGWFVDNVLSGVVIIICASVASYWFGLLICYLLILFKKRIFHLIRWSLKLAWSYRFRSGSSFLSGKQNMDTCRWTSSTLVVTRVMFITVGELACGKRGSLVELHISWIWSRVVPQKVVMLLVQQDMF